MKHFAFGWTISTYVANSNTHRRIEIISSMVRFHLCERTAPTQFAMAMTMYAHILYYFIIPLTFAHFRTEKAIAICEWVLRVHWLLEHDREKLWWIVHVPQLRCFEIYSRTINDKFHNLIPVFELVLDYTTELESTCCNRISSSSSGHIHTLAVVRTRVRSASMISPSVIIIIMCDLFAECTRNSMRWKIIETNAIMRKKSIALVHRAHRAHTAYTTQYAWYITCECDARRSSIQRNLFDA